MKAELTLAEVLIKDSVADLVDIQVAEHVHLGRLKTHTRNRVLRNLETRLMDTYSGKAAEITRALATSYNLPIGMLTKDYLRIEIPRNVAVDVTALSEDINVLLVLRANKFTMREHSFGNYTVLSGYIPSRTGDTFDNATRTAVSKVINKHMPCDQAKIDEVIDMVKRGMTIKVERTLDHSSFYENLEKIMQEQL